MEQYHQIPSPHLAFAAAKWEGCEHRGRHQNTLRWYHVYQLVPYHQPTKDPPPGSLTWANAHTPQVQEGIQPPTYPRSLLGYRLARCKWCEVGSVTVGRKFAQWLDTVDRLQCPGFQPFGLQGNSNLCGVWIVKRQRTIATTVGSKESRDCCSPHPSSGLAGGRRVEESCPS